MWLRILQGWQWLAADDRGTAARRCLSKRSHATKQFQSVFNTVYFCLQTSSYTGEGCNRHSTSGLLQLWKAAAILHWWIRWFVPQSGVPFSELILLMLEGSSIAEILILKSCSSNLPGSQSVLGFHDPTASFEFLLAPLISAVATALIWQQKKSDWSTFRFIQSCSKMFSLYQMDMWNNSNRFGKHAIRHAGLQYHNLKIKMLKAILIYCTKQQQ